MEENKRKMRRIERKEVYGQDLCEWTENYRQEREGRGLLVTVGGK